MPSWLSLTSCRQGVQVLWAGFLFWIFVAGGLSLKGKRVWIIIQTPLKGSGVWFCDHFSNI